jgi:hypothetical protein
VLATSKGRKEKHKRDQTSDVAEGFPEGKGTQSYLELGITKNDLDVHEICDIRIRFISSQGFG